MIPTPMSLLSATAECPVSVGSWSCVFLSVLALHVRHHARASCACIFGSRLLLLSTKVLASAHGADAHIYRRCIGRAAVEDL